MHRQYTFAKLLQRVASLWSARLDAHLRTWDMNIIAWQILWYLHFKDTRYNQYMLASQLDIETSHLVRLLDRMEKRDLLKRQMNPRDRRQNDIVITAAGMALVGKIETGIARLREAMLKNISESDLEHGIRLLERVLDNIIRMANSERPN
ncbi:MAG: MarR family transcriptional regulator [Azoarcus sp.]|jgi:DNA-binding MarR family transcriptional regulator|nr:MarR family transcriptional regulator [Azoarcus sp.]